MVLNRLLKNLLCSLRILVFILCEGDTRVLNSRALRKIDYWRVFCIWNIYRLTDVHAIWGWKTVTEELNILWILLSHLFLNLKILKSVSDSLNPRNHSLFLFFLISRELPTCSIPTRLAQAPERKMSCPKSMLKADLWVTTWRSVHGLSMQWLDFRQTQT